MNDELAKLITAMIDAIGRKRTAGYILDAHNGKPDGYYITSDNMHLVRRYRNSVSGNPAQLIEEALSYS